MTQPGAAPHIFDRAQLRRRWRRARLQGASDFLFARALDELAFRLAGVQRPFSHVLDCGAPLPGLTQALAAPGRRIVRMAPIVEAGADCVGDDEALPFAPQSFDCVCSLLALQGANDLPGAFAQMRRCLRPDGLLIGALAGGRTLHELRTAFAEAEIELTGGAAPRVAPFADVREIGGLLSRAGLALPVADVEECVVRYDDLFGLFADLRGFGATNVLAQRSRRGLTRAVLMRAAHIYRERFADVDGRVRATFEFIWFAGWAPHESQKKPLPRGSATMRLADALAAAQRRAEDGMIADARRGRVLWGAIARPGEPVSHWRSLNEGRGAPAALWSPP